MNEFIFILQLLLLLLPLLAAVRLGKEALICWVVISAILANLFVLKQITLFGFSATASDTLAVSSILALNLTQEHFGQESAKKATLISFWALLLFAGLSHLHLLYAPSSADTTQGAYQLLLKPAVRLFLASLTAFFLTQRFDLFFFAKLKNWLPHAPFWLRSSTSSLSSQLLDTVLFSFLGLYGQVESIFSIICISFTIKTVVVLLAAPFTALSKRLKESYAAN